MGHYEAQTGNFVPTFRGNLFQNSRINSKKEDGTHRLSRKVGKELPLYAALTSQNSAVQF